MSKPATARRPRRSQEPHWPSSTHPQHVPQPVIPQAAGRKSGEGSAGGEARRRWWKGEEEVGRGGGGGRGREAAEKINHSKETMLTFLLVLILKGVLCEDLLLDVCSTCHTHATCDKKTDGSGKECNCRNGFVGNGISSCQDKDECQLRAKICGPHTACHNTYGSYYCTCSEGYSPSNYSPFNVFIPNDGTRCQDVDECSMDATCGVGAQCRNLLGSFDCSCLLGYQVHGGVEPFRPTTNGASCRVVDCGRPAQVNHAVLLSVTETLYGGVATFACVQGFVQKEGDSSSACGADGLWTPPTMVCEVVDCGRPSQVNHAVLLSVTETSYGGVATSACVQGFVQREGDSSSVCGADGLWTPLTMVCEEVDCGPPPKVPHARVAWSSSGGTEVRYGCNHGYRNVGRSDGSVCGANGQWEEPELLCQETSCGRPPVLEATRRLWDGSSSPGSTAFYLCQEGFDEAGGQNQSVCGENAQWSSPSLSCREKSCGDPPTLSHAGQVWNGTSSPGSTVSYYCNEGFYSSGGHNQSVCTGHGLWTDVSISCQAECGPAPRPAHSEVVHHNSSVVVHRCVPGYDHQGGSNTSVCQDSGQWQEATLTCAEAAPPISQLEVQHGRCLQWRADRKQAEPRVYQVAYSGSRDFQASFHHQGRESVSSKEELVEICLDLLPLTNYSVSVTVQSPHFTTAVSTCTPLTAPPTPEVSYTEVNSLLPTLRLRRSADTLERISEYQVFVLPVVGTVVFRCSCPPPLQHLAAQLDLRRVGTEVNFTVGDGRYYGGAFNAPLETGRSYYVVLRAVRRWRAESKSSCVLWAKVLGPFFALTVASLGATASVALLLLLSTAGYALTRCLKKK